MDYGEIRRVAKIFLRDSPALDGDGVADCARRGFGAKAVPKMAIRNSAQMVRGVGFSWLCHHGFWGVPSGCQGLGFPDGLGGWASCPAKMIAG